MKALVKKTRRPRGTGAPKAAPTKITAEQYPSMHEYCLTQDDIDSQRRYQRKRTGNDYIPKTPMVPVCEHPEQGFCSHNQPTPNQLAAINARLGLPAFREKYPNLEDMPVKHAEAGFHPERESGWSSGKASSKKKRKYTKKPGVVYGRPKK